MRSQRRDGWWGASAGVLFAGAVGCTPPTTSPSATGGAPAKQPEPSAKVEPEVKPVAPEVRPVEPSGSVESLDGRSLIASNQGGWTLRKTDGGGGADGGGLSSSYGTIGGLSGKGRGSGYGSGGGGDSRRERSEEAAAPAMARTGGPPATKPSEPVSDAPLKAGSTDDNADFKGYLNFLATWTARPDVAGDYQPLDVAGRVFVKVIDGDKRALPGVTVTISEAVTKAPLIQATTYGDGRAPYYPKLFGAAVQQGGRLEASAVVGGETVTATWDGQSDLTLAAAAPVATQEGLALDVVFLLDTTGSMGDELERIKTSLLAVADKLKRKRSDLKLRYAAVAYKDINDDYVTMAHPFTEDTGAFNEAMKALSAGGGGDLPESLNQGLSRAVEGLEWRTDAAKVVFLVADAPPQMRFKGDVLYGDSAVRAVAKGIRVHSVAASGLDPLGTLVLRQIAQLTRGKFIFIEYGKGTQETAASHGVSGPVEGGNNLDEILLAQLTAEIEGWGK